MVMNTIRQRVVGLIRVPAKDLVPHPQNWRSHPRAQRAAMEGALKELGMADALLVRKLPDGRFQICDGHLRQDVLKDQEVPCLLLDLDDIETKKLLTVLDPIGAMARADSEQLDALLKGISFDDAALNKLVDGLARDAGIELNEPLSDEAEVEPPAEPVTQLGDVWLLGNHRLMCGDSLKAEDVTRLMNGQRAVMMATDSPYLVDYQGGNHPQSSVNKPDVKDKHWDDYVDDDASVEFFYGFLKLALDAALIDNPPIYTWHASRRQALLEAAWVKAGLFVHQQIVWKKTRAVLTYSHFMWGHEPCFYGWKKGKQPTSRPAPDLSTVWEIPNENEGWHPTQKPLEIFGIPIRAHTQKGDVVYEPFSGSGSQIVAAEKLERRCFAMELSPAFVDAGVTRWQKVFGKKAVNETRPSVEVA